jgi:hypothetical protein
MNGEGSVSPDEPLEVRWYGDYGQESRAPRDRVGIFHAFPGDAVDAMEKALGDGTKVFACAEVILVDQKGNRVIPFEAPTLSEYHGVVSALGCASDGHVHSYVGVHDASTGTSHLLSDTDTGVLCSGG